MDHLKPIGHREATRAQVKALAHPLRLRMIELLREAPSTATLLAQALGESTGSTSYHLRALARVGVIVEDTERGRGRERWWRRVDPFIQIPTGAEDPEGRALEAQVQSIFIERDDEALSRFWAGGPELDSETRHATFVGNWNVYLTPDEATALAERFMETIDPFRRSERDRPPGSRRFFVTLRALPWIENDKSSLQNDHDT
jgi:DNA-binding transcriptional ArsR family regulator